MPLTQRYFGSFLTIGHVLKTVNVNFFEDSPQFLHNLGLKYLSTEIDNGESVELWLLYMSR